MKIRNNTLFVNGEFNATNRLFEELIFEINNAKIDIRMEYFVFEKGHAFNEIVMALKNAVRRGVKVFILCDEYGTKKRNNNAYRDLISIGCHIKSFNLGKEYSFFKRKNVRTHRKLTVVDSRIAFIGSSNITDKNLIDDSWIDFDFKLTGRVATKLNTIFMENWYHFDNSAEIHSFNDLIWKNPDKMGIIATNSILGTGENCRRKYDLISKAQKSVYIVTPYMSLDKYMFDLIKEKREQGVKFFFIVPANSDSRVLDYSNEYIYSKLKELGCVFFMTRNKMIHAKALVIDSKTAVVGSSNFDMRSHFINLELDIVITDYKNVKEVEKKITKVFKEDLYWGATFKSGLGNKIVYKLLKKFI